MGIAWDLSPKENGTWGGISVRARAEISVNLGVMPDAVHI
jgi:hypothetical protein